MVATAAALAAFDLERSGGGRLRLAGIDEVGCGCWAGPLVAAAVVLPAGWAPEGLDDSKRLTARRRERIAAEIRAHALAWAACAAPPADIDRRGLRAATLRAMARAAGRLRPPPQVVLVDGLAVPLLPCPAQALPRADGSSAAVAAASVLAKVLRDRLMGRFDRLFPGYGFAEHKGYGSAVHREALRRLGPCRIHRRSFRPVASLAQGRLWNDPR